MGQLQVPPLAWKKASQVRPRDRVGVRPTYCYGPEEKFPGCWCYWCWFWCCEGLECGYSYGSYYCEPYSGWCNCWS